MNKDFLNNHDISLQQISIVAETTGSIWIDTTSFDAVTFTAVMAPVFDTLDADNYIEVAVADSSGFACDDCLSYSISGENSGTFGVIKSSDVVLATTTYCSADPVARLFFTFVGTHTNGSAIVSMSIKHGFHGEYPIL